MARYANNGARMDHLGIDGVFFGFLGFKLFVGTFSERLLKEVVAKQHQEFCVRFDRLSTAIERLERALRERSS